MLLFKSKYVPNEILRVDIKGGVRRRKRRRRGKEEEVEEMEEGG